MQMSASSDHGTQSGSKGPSMSLLDSYVGSARCPTSQSPITLSNIQGRSAQICQRRISV